MAQINKSSEYFNTKLYTGNGSTQSITGVGFQPDLLWFKNRDSAINHMWFDSVRGIDKYFYGNLSEAEGTSATILTAIGSDGFSVGANNNVNGSGNGIASWNWKANGAGVSNTAGSITSTVSANTTSGFSVGKTTGTLSSGTITVGHGLGTSNIGMVLWKRTDGASNWQVYHKSTGVNLTQLNTTGAVTSGTNYWGTPTSTTFTVESSLYGSGETYVFYCFAEKKGFSKFGSYTGNGSADGTFIYTGFKPAFVMFKNTSSALFWQIHDSARDSFNEVQKRLAPNSSDAEGSGSIPIDFLSNGIKLRTTATTWNESGSNFIYMAFAENPLVGTNNIPTTAR